MCVCVYIGYITHQTTSNQNQSPELGLQGQRPKLGLQAHPIGDTPTTSPGYKRPGVCSLQRDPPPLTPQVLGNSPACKELRKGP
jgi:hypothetical protein